MGPYLGAVQLPHSHPEPLTFHHLLTHTDGFEARMIGGAGLTEADLEPLADLLNTYMPAHPHVPGQYMTYGNFAANLAGHLTAEIEQRPFEQIVTDNILTPLGMANSTFDQRLTDEMAARLAAGYEFADGDFVPVPFLYIRYAPESGLRTTANDMARWKTAVNSSCVMVTVWVRAAAWSCSPTKRWASSSATTAAAAHYA